MSKSETLKSLFEKKEEPIYGTETIIVEDRENVEEMISMRTPVEITRDAASPIPKMPKARRKRKAAKGASYAGILRECAGIADRREKQYGDAAQNFRETAAACKVMWGIELSPESIVKILISLKYVRQKFLPKQDNLLDGINYTAILAKMTETKDPE